MSGHFASFDGTAIAWAELGRGRPVLLLHGLFSNAATNWVRVIMPDLRGHGSSASPPDAAAWPADVLARDAEALIGHLGLVDYDLGGYSLGARTVLRLLARRLAPAPRCAVLSGMGLQGIIGGTGRAAWFTRMIDGRGSWPRGSAEATAEAFMVQQGIDPLAIRHLLAAQRDTPPADLAGIATPALVLCGAHDTDNGSAPDLAAALLHARYQEIPGTHMSAVTKPDFGAAIAGYLAA
jgi:pimeloyl-ACP methyl ester carboxylesterase